MAETSIPQKRCSKCGENKPLSEFYKHSACKDGLRPDCIDCGYASIGKTRPTPRPDGMKWCAKCQRYYPATIEFFFVRKRGGWSGHCRNCHKIALRERRKDPVRGKRLREKSNETSKVRYETDKDYAARRRQIAKKRYDTKKTDAEWVANERKRTADAQRRRRQNSNVLEQEREYRKSQQGRRVAKSAAHRYAGRVRNLPADFSPSQWLDALSYWNNSCAICGQARDFWHTIAADHWIPITDKRFDNPGTVANNILPLCHSVKGSNGLGACNQSKSDKDPIKWLNEYLGKRKAKTKLAEIEAYFEWVKSRNNNEEH